MTRLIFTPGVTLPDPIDPDALLFLGRGVQLAVQGEGASLRIPTLEAGRQLGDGLHFLGTLAGRQCFASPLAGREVPEGWSLIAARSLFSALDLDTFAVAGRAIAVAEWDRLHRFCGRCGHPTVLVTGQRVRRCPECRTPFYPRIAPAVIVLIHRGDEVLLARNAAFPGSFFSTLAGFVEPGESLEDAVAREVREEVGLELSDIRYFGSQPWPFGRSLMVGFNARYAGGELRPDPAEIAEARWFRADDLPQIPPKLSIARQLIDAWAAPHLSGRTP